MADEFTGWVRGVLEVGLTDPEVRLASRMKILDFFKAQIDDRKANPRDDDLITELLNAEVDGEPVPEDYVLGVCNLMLVAGIDTTWSAIGSSLWHLAQHPEHRRQLRDSPSCGRRPSRSCCGPTRRSPWPASSTTTPSSRAARCTPATGC